MPSPPHPPIRYARLYDSPLVHVRDYVCSAARGGPAAEEESTQNNVVLMRRGAFCRHFGRERVTADVNQAVFFSKHAVSRVSHPVDCGDRGTVLSIAPRVLNDIVRELDPTIDEHPERPFPFHTGPCDTALFWRHREFVRRLEETAEKPLEPLWADITALQLVADVLDAAFARQGTPKKPRRAGTADDHRDRTEEAKSFMARSLASPISLEDVARAVNASPYHFARVFQERTGLPVHRYLTRLRLRAALERVAAGESDLTSLSLEFGFSSHSHFTDTFRREFGCAPSAVRGKSTRQLRQMSKNLEV